METWISMHGRLGLNIELADVLEATKPGENAPAVARLRALPYIAEQLESWKAEDVRRELRDAGAWSETELADDSYNVHRLLWLACHDVAEQAAELARYPGGRGD